MAVRIPRPSHVKLVRRVRAGGGKGIKVVRFGQFFPAVVNEVIKANATQMRVLAEGSADLLINKIFAQVNPGNAVVSKPDALSAGKGIKGENVPFDHEPLSPAYARYKLRNGLDGRILLAMGDYVNSIEVFRSETKEAGITYRVRNKPGRHYSGLTYQQLGLVHEFGSSKAGIPARPHWRPVASLVLKRFRRLTQSATAADIRAALSRIR